MISKLRAQFHLIQGIRDFFQNQGFMDVLTPPMVENPGMEVHIHPFGVHKAQTGEDSGYYLHTSPEFHMKELLSHGMEKVFTISYCFRDGPDSPHHRTQFLMLEWYRTNTTYHTIMQDCENLISFCYQYLKGKDVPVNENFKDFKLTKKTVQELFLEHLDIDILQYLEIEQIKELIIEKYPDIPLPKDTTLFDWDDYFFLIFLNKIDPILKKIPNLLLYEFPCHLAALSTLRSDDLRVSERFEIYLGGMELCNCFNELCDLKEQKKRFTKQLQAKETLYNYSLPQPEVLYSALERGAPPSSGIALGIERMLMALTNIENPFWK